MTPESGPERPEGVWLNGVPVDGADASVGRRSTAPQARTLVLMSSTVTIVPVVLGVVVAVIGHGIGTSPQLLPMLVPVAVGVLAAVLINVVGFRAEPLPAGATGDEATSLGLQRFTSGFFIRFALAEVPALVALAMTFAFPPVDLLTYVPGGVLAVLLMVAYVRPSRSTVARVENVLDAEGARSGLSAQFGY